MTENSPVRAGKWIWPVLGLSCCLLLALSANAYFAPRHLLDPSDEQASTTEDGGEDDEKPEGQPAASTAIGKTQSPASGTTQTAAQTAPKEKPPLGQITVLVPEKKFKKEGPNKALRLGSFDDIDIEKVLNTKQLSVDLPEKMPQWLRDLNGKRVRLRGYMHPGSAFQAEGIKRFIFCRDTRACCFGPDPTIFYLITTTMRSGTSMDYVDREAFDIEGVFRIEPIVAEKSGLIAEFYHLDDAQLVKGKR
jgi:hypothetical protein